MLLKELWDLTQHGCGCIKENEKELFERRQNVWQEEGEHDDEGGKPDCCTHIFVMQKGRY